MYWSILQIYTNIRQDLVADTKDIIAQVPITNSCKCDYKDIRDH